MDGWRQALTSAIEGIPQDVTPKAIRQVFNAGIKARQPVQPVTVSRHTELVATWCETYEKQFTAKYVFLGKDAMAAKTLLASLEPEHVMRIAKAAWAHKDTYPCSMSLTLPKLLSHINEIREWLNANRNGKPKGFTKVPPFKQIEIVKANLATHPCNPRSISYDPDASHLKGDYTDLKAKLAALEQEQRKQVLG